MSWLPDRKIVAGGVAGIVAWGIAAGLKHYGVELDANAQTMLVGLVTGLIAYVVPPSQRDILKRLDDNLVQIAQNSDAYPNVTKPPAGK